MRRIATFILLALSAVCFAQTEKEGGLKLENQQPLLLDESSASLPYTIQKDDALKDGEISSFNDSICMPPIAFAERNWMKPTLFSVWRPWMPFGTGGLWNLHKGLNAEIGAGVMVGFGKDNPFHGASFFSNASMMYVQPLNDRWTVAVGGGLSKFRMWNDDVFSARVEAMVNYKINERLDATVFGIHNFSPSGEERRSYMPFVDRCSAVGAALNWKYSEWGSIGISFTQEFDHDPYPMMPEHHVNNGKPRR